MSHKNDTIRIAVIGGREASPDALDFAFKVGKLLAEHGVILYSGGGSGVMEAASRGASEAGGMVVGILKEIDGSDANQYIQVPILTGVGDLRNSLIIRSVHGAIAVEGAYGTLSEIAYTLGYGKPMVGFNSWDIEGLYVVETAETAVEKVLQMIKATRS